MMTVQSARVLLVDDDHAALLTTTRVLEQAGMRVRHIRQGHTALALLESESFDLVLLDLHMPDVDGLTLLRQLRQQGSDVPVLLITGSSDQAALDAAVCIGIQGILHKPLSAETLLTATTTALRHHGEHRRQVLLATIRPLLEISRIPPQQIDVAHLGGLLLETLHHEVGGDRLALLMFDSDDTLTLIASIGIASPTVVAVGAQLEARLLTEQQTISVNRAVLDDALRLGDGSAPAAVLLVPLVGEQTLLGVVVVGRDEPAEPFSASERELAELLTQQAAALLFARHRIDAWQREAAERQRIARQVAQAEKLDAVSRLATAIAHEINNPLQAIHNSLHLLLHRPLAPEKRQRYLELAQQEVEGLIGLVRRTLDAHQPMQEGMRQVQLRPLVEAALAKAALQLEQAGIAVHCTWAPNLPPIVAVASHLKQAVLNIVLNACDAMAHGGTLEIRTMLSEELGSQQQSVVLEIGDTGPGIDPETLERIFEPFYSTKPHNPGLGLTTSYNIVVQHGGMLNVRSTAHAATVFEIRLPALSENR
jgi:signal transduction histidine kinase/DNA-binding response OmpR family regulator